MQMLSYLFEKYNWQFTYWWQKGRKGWVQYTIHIHSHAKICTYPCLHVYKQDALVPTKPSCLWPHIGHQTWKTYLQKILGFRILVLDVNFYLILKDLLFLQYISIKNP